MLDLGGGCDDGLFFRALLQHGDLGVEYHELPIWTLVSGMRDRGLLPTTLGVCPRK